MKPLILLATIIALFASCSNPNTAKTKITFAKIDTTTLPKGIRHKGSIDTAIKYVDNEGQHILITSEDADVDTDKRLTGVYLYAYSYKLADDKWSLQWQLHDFVNQCEEDVAGEF